MAKPFVVPGAAVAVTATTTNLIFAPPPGLGQGGYGSAVLTNCSPWIATVNCASGSVSLQPYTADIVNVSGIQQLIVSMSVPAGSPGVPQVYTYVEVDWYAAGGGDPPGTYPISLTAQVLAGLLNIGTQTFEAATDVAIPVAGTYNRILNLSTLTFPAGTSLANYNSAIVQLFNTVVGSSEDGVLVAARDATGGLFYVQEVWIPEGTGSATVVLPLGGMTGIWVNPALNVNFIATVVLTQEVVPNPAALGYCSWTGALTPLLTNYYGQLLVGASTVPTTKQVAVGAVATAISTPSLYRTAMTIHVPAAAAGPVFIGPLGVTAATGYMIEPGHSQTVASVVQWYGITGGGSITVSYVDE
jgi:hypothetical protein